MEEHSTHTDKVTVVRDVPKEEEAHKEHHKSTEHHKSHTKHEHKSQHNSKKIGGISGLKKPFWQYLSAALAILLVIVLFAQYDLDVSITKTSSADTDDTAAEDSDEGTTDGAVAVYVESDYYDEDDPMIGDEDATVTIVEFSDFQCPYCSRFYTDAYLSIKENYIDTGKVKLVFRDFPLSFHSEAEPAALAAECAHEQDMFWEFHDMIFENQDDMSSSAYLAWATELGMDIDQFSECVEAETYASEVSEDYNAGGQLGVTGTPGFFINGELVVGAQPYSVFAAAIEAALEG